MVFGTGRAVAFTGVLIAQAGKLIAAADAIAVARFGRRLDRDERHCSGIVRFLLRTCKREWRLASRSDFDLPSLAIGRLCARASRTRWRGGDRRNEEKS